MTGQYLEEPRNWGLVPGKSKRGCAYTGSVFHETAYQRDVTFHVSGGKATKV
jgi:hypothetical protein